MNNKHNRSIVRRRACIAALLAAPLASFAAPPGLSFTLKIVRPTNAGPTSHVYDPATLTALGATQVATHVPWDAERSTWEGVGLKRLLAAHQVAGRPLRVKALNDYVAVIPWADIEQFDPLLAWHRDGQPIRVRDKGPLLVIYPFAMHPELKRAEYIDRSVWHVNEIVVE
jgi:hypothetical protein